VREREGRVGTALEPELEPRAVHHPLGKKKSIKVLALVDEDLTRLLLELVAAGSTDQSPDRVVGLRTPVRGRR
jgi:hypothetical protein